MRRLHMLILFLLLLPVWSCGQKDHIENCIDKTIYDVTRATFMEGPELSYFGLKGKVKSVINYKTYPIPKDSVIDMSVYQPFEDNYPVLTSFDERCVVSFNEKGNMLVRTTFTHRFSEDCVNIDSLEYDMHDRLVVNRYSMNLVTDTFSNIVKYKYNDEGHLSEHTINEFEKCEIEYNDLENSVKIKEYEGSKLKYTKTLIYDKCGNEIEFSKYNSDGSLDSRWEYIYDKDGKREKEILYTPDGKKSEYGRGKPKGDTISMLAHFDEHGNYMSRILLENGRPKYIKKRIIEYY